MSPCSCNCCSGDCNSCSCSSCSVSTTFVHCNSVLWTLPFCLFCYLSNFSNKYFLCSTKYLRCKLTPCLCLDVETSTSTFTSQAHTERAQATMNLFASLYLLPTIDNDTSTLAKGIRCFGWIAEPWGKRYYGFWGAAYTITMTDMLVS